MRQIKLLVLAALTLLAFAAALASSAPAAELLLENLPEVANRTFTGEQIGGTSTFETLAKTKFFCTSATAEGVEETNKPPLGSLHIHFLGCLGEILKVKSKCNSLGDLTEQILILIKWHLVHDKIGAGAELKTAMLYLISPSVHLECAGGVLILISGNFLCLHLNDTTNSTTHETHCVQTSGMPEDKLWFTSNETMLNAQLLSSLNGATAEEGALLALFKQVTTAAIVADQ
jgi:hypothetical protein